MSFPKVLSAAQGNSMYNFSILWYTHTKQALDMAIAFKHYQIHLYKVTGFMIKNTDFSKNNMKNWRHDRLRELVISLSATDMMVMMMISYNQLCLELMLKLVMLYYSM